MTQPKNTLPFLLVLTALLVSACNTIAGAGKDIEAGGNAIEEAADDDE